MATERVRALTDIRSANGNRSAGDEFDYDLRADRDGLKRLGAVERVAAETAAEPGAGEDAAAGGKPKSK